MTATLYVVPASHPCATVTAALELKGVPFKTVAWVPGFHKLAQKARFGTGTVPGIVFDDGAKVLGSRAILRELERRVPEPALYDGDPETEQAEAWGENVLQPLVRRVLWHALSRDTAAQLTYVGDTRMTPPTPLAAARATGRPLGWLERRLNASTPAAVAADLGALPGHLERIDAWIGSGVLGGGRPNAADLQIAASLRLLLTLDDLQPLIDTRPAGALARRWFAQYPGRVKAGALDV